MSTLCMGPGWASVEMAPVWLVAGAAPLRRGTWPFWGPPCLGFFSYKEGRLLVPVPTQETATKGGSFKMGTQASSIC